MHRGALLFLLFVLLISSCSPQPVQAINSNGQIIVSADPNASVTPTPFQPVQPTDLPTLPPTLTPTPAPTETASPTSIVPTDTPTATPVPASARANYLVYATLDYDNHRVDVDELIAYPNTTSLPLNGLVVVAEPNLWLNCFNLKSVTVNGVEVTTYSLASHQLQIILPTVLQPGETVTLGLTFTLKLPQKNQEQIFGYSSSQTNLVNWIPFVAPYAVGTGWLIHDPWAWGEHLVYDASDFEVNLKIMNPDTGVTIAASAAAEANGEWTRYRLQKARTFVLSASPYFVTVSGNVGGIAITSYYFEGHELAGSAALSEIGLAVNLFTSLFGKPPYKSLSIVETYFVDGMEFDGLVFLSRNFYEAYDGTSQNNLTTIGVHESAHQWWFGMVGNDQALEPWLDEAMAVYAERLFYENTYPGQQNWWWNYRVRYYDPNGYVDTTIYDGGSFRNYTNEVYLVGAYFLEALRQRIGDEAFFAFLKDYAAQMSQRRAMKADFFRILNQHTPTDYSDIMKNYFQNP